MKKLLSILIILTLFACGGDDDGNDEDDISLNSNFETEVENLTTQSATITWNAPTNFSGDVIYRVVLENETVADGLQATQYTFENLDDNKNYSGTIFAESTNDEQTFSNFIFTTAPITVLSGTATLTTQIEVDNFIYTEVDRLVIEGTNITNLDGLANLEIIRRSVNINNTSLSNLNGLNATTHNDGSSIFNNIFILNNYNLNDVSNLSPFFAGANNITITNNTSLTQLNGFQLKNIVKDLIISNCPISSIPVLNTTSFSELILRDLPISNLNFLSNVETIQGENLFFLIDRLPNISNLSGLDSLERLLVLNIYDCENLTSFDGAPNLTRGFVIGNQEQAGVTISNNINLTDFCGLTTWVTNTSPYIEWVDEDGNITYHFGIGGNAYNPTEQQIESTTECSL